jgi:hypothetical protein
VEYGEGGEPVFDFLAVRLVSEVSSMNEPSRNSVELSDHDRFLCERTEEAIRDGIQLRAWCLKPGNVKRFPLDLKKQFRLPNQAYGFFGELQFHGRPTSVMGCQQEVKFGVIEKGDASALLREFVLARFLPTAHWTYPDGNPGGFTLDQILYKTRDATIGKFPPEQVRGCVDWRRLESELEWVLPIVQIHDFVMNVGPFVKRLKEAAAVAPHAAFMNVAENPTREHTLEVTIGYPFIKFAPIPNFFGFGPGKFGVAVKLFSFLLTPRNEVEVRMTFAAAPRCQKVFDFGAGWPDPIYGGAALLRRLTFGAFNEQAIHTKMDTEMLAQHCRVHQAVMDGSAEVFREWLTSGPTIPRNS